MKIYYDYENTFFNEENRGLGNCITINDSTKEYYYEFCINTNEALIKCNNDIYINEAIEFYRKYNKFINIFYNEDRTFYKQYDSIFSFKLPIKVIQPSKFFLNGAKLDYFDNNFNLDNICLPVAIINDEYVLLDGHHRLACLNQNFYKMVNVYIDNYEYHINDFVYIAKENNIFNIKNLKVFSDEDYKREWEEFYNQYFEYN